MSRCLSSASRAFWGRCIKKNSLDRAFMMSVKDCPRLTRREERRLVLRWRWWKDQAILDRLVLSVTPLAIKLTKDYINREGIGRDEHISSLIGVSTCAIIRAVETLDLQYRLSTWVRWQLRRELETYTEKETNLIRVPRHALEGRGSEKYRPLVAKALGCTFLGGDVPEISTELPEENDLEISDEASQRLLRIERVMETCLKPRERHVIERRFFHDESLAVLGESLGLTRERVRQIQENALKKIRERISCQE